MTIRILVVEDDREIRHLLQSALQAEGYTVQTAVSVQEASAMLAHSLPDVLLLDLGLPDGDGSSVVRSVRQRSSLPILVISARHQEEQKIALLDAGADDYLVKPFGVHELLARIRVGMRHRGTAISAATLVHTLDDLHIDLHQHRVLLAGQEVHLTPTEYQLLARLARQAGRVVTHRQLLADVWGPEHTEHTHYLRLYMGQLRAKLELNPAEPRHILTETGIGYRLAVE